MYENNIESAEEELKRADHLIFVSLKYTRTCDIMKNAIKRMIVAYDLMMLDYLESKRKKQSMEEVPISSKERVALVKKLLGNNVKKYITLYNLLKEIAKSEYTATEEFRKNVTMTLKGKKVIAVKVENLYNYLEVTKEFVVFMRQQIKDLN